MKKMLPILFAIVCLFPTMEAFASSLSPELAAVDAYLENSFPSTYMPGMSVCIVDTDSILYSKTFGDCESVDTPFIIGSMSKSFTAVAVMQLVEQGLVDLDAPVTAYLQVDLDDKVTLRHLLNHTSGFLPYQNRNSLTVHENYGSHVYSNLNYGLLGEVVEAVFSLSYGKYIKHNIFEPLYFTDSYTSLSEAKGIAAGHQNFFGFPVKMKVPYPEDTASYTWQSIPAGYIISSSADIGRYLQAYLNGGGSILSPQSVDSLLYNGVPIPGEDEAYAFGWQEASGYNEKLIYHGGLVENYTSVMCLLPDSGRGMVMLFNMNDYIVANGLASTLSIDAIRLMMGMEPEGVRKRDYIMPHLFFNILFFIVLLLSIIPLLRLRRWNRKLVDGTLRFPLLTGIALHIIYPLLLLSIPLLISTPYSTVWAFAPDIIMASVFSALLSLSCGSVKLVKWAIIHKGKVLTQTARKEI